MTSIKTALSFFLWAIAALAAVSVDACAESSEPAQESAEPITYKLTLSHYSTNEIHANDINLRANQDNQTAWIGFYEENPTGFNQVRGGYERTDQILSAHLLTSLQAADHGFLGYALTADYGEPFFGLIGFARTNLKPYANLNFDPNDAVTVGFGWREKDGPSLTLFAVRDDRVIPGQQIVHAVWREPLANGHSMIVDIFDKSGPHDAQNLPINGTGCALTYDWPQIFVKLAYDPKVNFTQQNMVRLSFGMRF